MGRLDELRKAAGDRGTVDMGHPIIQRLGIYKMPEHESPEYDNWFDADQLHQVHPHEMRQLGAWEPLHTTQTILNIPTLEHFLHNPNDPTRWIEAEGYDAPHVYTFKGDNWVHEGHHRIVASRLRGEPSLLVMRNHVKTEWD